MFASSDIRGIVARVLVELGSAADVRLDRRRRAMAEAVGDRLEKLSEVCVRRLSGMALLLMLSEPEFDAAPGEECEDWWTESNDRSPPTSVLVLARVCSILLCN